MDVFLYWTRYRAADNGSREKLVLLSAAGFNKANPRSFIISPLSFWLSH